MLKNINKILKNYTKNFKLNKQNLVSSVKSAGFSLIKIFLLNRLQKIKHFKHVSLILLIITKWSLFSIITTFVYGKISSIFGFKYDLDFFIGFGSAIGAIYSEVSWDMVSDYWLKIVDLYNRFIAKIVVKLSENPDTVDYSKKAKDLITKYNDKMPTDSRVRLKNQEEFIEYYVNKQIEEEKLKDPNYRPNKGWFTWYPWTLKETISIISVGIGIIGAISTTLYFFDSIRTFVEGFQSVINTLNEVNNMRRNFPRYVGNWLFNRVWPFGNIWPFGNQEANVQLPVEPAQNNNSWFGWVSSFLPFGRNNIPTNTDTNNVNTDGRSWLFMIGNPWRAAHRDSTDDDNNSQNSSNSLSPIESDESERQNRENIRNLNLNRLKSTVCSFLNIKEDISDKELFDSLKGQENIVANEGTMEYLAIKEWMRLQEVQSSSTWRVIRQYFSPMMSRQNSGNDTRNYDNNNDWSSDSDSEEDIALSAIDKGKAKMRMPGGFNWGYGNPISSSSSINPEEKVLPVADPSSGQSTPTPPTPRANTLNVNNENFTQDPANVPLPDSPIDDDSAVELSFDSPSVWAALFPIILKTSSNFNIYLKRAINLIIFIYTNYNIVYYIAKCYFYIFKDNIKFYLSESFYFKYNLYIDKIKNYFINKNIIKEHIKEYIKKPQIDDNENKLAITYFVKNYEYGLGGKISYKFADTIFLHYHWDIYPNQKIKNVAMEGYFILSVFIKKNPDSEPIIVIDYDLNSLHKDDDNYIKNYQGHFNFNTILDNVLRKYDLNKPHSSFIIVFEYEYITQEEYQEYIIERS